MRKNLFVLLAAALMVVTGCKKDDNTAGNDNGAKMTFTATIDNGGSKTTIEGVDMNWTKGDVISINGKDFTADEAGPSTTFTGDEVGKKDGKYMAYYLVTMGEGGSLSLPAFQTYAGANLAGVNPMYAESTTTEFLFHNICALIKLDLKGTGSVKTITASANQPLKGTFEILTNQDGYYAHATSTAEADKSVVLNCGDGVALNGTNATTFYIALPQGEYTGLKFTLSNGTCTYPIEISGNKTLTAGIMYGKEVAGVDTGVEFVATVPEGALKGKFSVSDNKQVYFAKGNLWCNSNANPVTWGFESAQNSYSTSWDASHVSLFHWTSLVSVAYECGCYDGFASAYDPKHPEVFPFFTNTSSFSVNGSSEWRTLSRTELEYLLNNRTMKYGKQRYTNGNSGLFIYPDDYNGSELSSFSDATEAGVVFLPRCGYRNRQNFYENGLCGCYWCSDLDPDYPKPHADHAHNLLFNSSVGVQTSKEGKADLCNARALRLVREVK